MFGSVQPEDDLSWSKHDKIRLSLLLSTIFCVVLVVKY